MSLLRPSEEAMRRFARRETDVRYAAEFEPIARGPLVAVLLILAAGLAGAVRAIFIFAIRLIRGRR